MHTSSETGGNGDVDLLYAGFIITGVVQFLFFLKDHTASLSQLFAQPPGAMYVSQVAHVIAVIAGVVGQLAVQ